MGRYINLYVVDIDFPHDKQKICMNYEKEPIYDKYDENNKYSELAEIITICENPNYTAEQYSNTRILRRNIHTIVFNADSNEKLCKRCMWFFGDDFRFQHPIIIEQYDIYHCNSNKIMRSDLFIDHFYYLAGKDAEEYDHSHYAIQRYSLEDIRNLKQELEEAKEKINKVGDTYIRENDKDAYYETLNAFDWAEKAFTRYSNRNIEILYYGELY
jgi:hypothetical protein